ncbi:MAG: type II toxin-antitoxin system VapC family toxin [bacterium]|nr:type II toxin-antitoxin system VapC family toxin [bacterium]
MEEVETQRICIDTDVIIDYLREIPVYGNVLSWALEEYECCVSPITTYELYYGGFYSEKMEGVRDVLSSLIFLPWDNKSSEEATRIHVDLVKQGMDIGVKDILIAGICLSSSLPLLTRNVDHFSRIPGLNVINVEDVYEVVWQKE